MAQLIFSLLHSFTRSTAIREDQHSTRTRSSPVPLPKWQMALVAQQLPISPSTMPLTPLHYQCRAVDNVSRKANHHKK